MRACRALVGASRTGWYETQLASLLTAELATARVHADNFRHPA